MKNNFSLGVFICVFFLSLFITKLGAEQPGLPFDTPDKVISMDFQDANIKDILKIFSVQSGLNFIASDLVKDRRLTLYFDNVTIKDALDKIFKANNLAYELDKRSNIFIVNDLGAPEIQTITKVFYLKFASVSNSKIISEKKNDKVITTISDAGGADESTADEETKAAGIARVVEKLLSEKGKVVEDSRTNSLIVTDVPSRISAISDVILSLDVPQPQVLLEVEMLDVYKDATDKIGLKFGTSPLTLNTVLQGASWGAKFPYGNMFGDHQKNFTNGLFRVSDGSTSSAVSTYQIVLDFLSTQVGTKFLARPRILTLNNETAELKISTNESIGTITVTQGQGASSVITTNAERAETGVFLRVTPQVNPDTNEITMFIIPAVGESVTGTAIGSQAVSSYRDPEIRYTKSMIRVKDGETIVIGGLIRRSFSETITKLPFLGDIPMLGGLFRHRYKDKDRDRELLVFLTPHIMKDTGVKLAQAKKTVFPEREQSPLEGTQRRAIIHNSLKNYEKR